MHCLTCWQALHFVNVLFMLAIWFWQKVGVYGVLVLSVFAFGFNMYIGLPITNALFGLVGPIILVFLVKNKWQRFK